MCVCVCACARAYVFVLYLWQTAEHGREAAERFADTIVSGIYGGNARHLSMRACFPSLVALEQQYGSVILGAPPSLSLSVTLR